MNILQACIHTPLAKALGWTLFHFLWEGAAIAALLLIALLLCRRAAARLRYALACLALLAMPVAFSITLAVSMPPSAPRFAIRPPAPLAQEWIAVSAGPSSPAPIAWADRLAWAGPFWLAGVLGIFLYRMGSWMAAQRLRRVGTLAPPENWRLRLETLVRHAGISRPVALLESYLAEIPVVIGWLRPAIVTPIGMLAGLPSEQVEAILLHELAHIRRADYVVNLVQIAVEGLLFYHPALWWVSGVVRAEREHCCDDWAAAQLGNAHRYASALAALEESPWRAPRTAMAASGGNLLFRIRRLLAKPDARDLAVPALPAMLLLVSVGVALAAWSPARPPQKPGSLTPAPIAAIPVPQLVAQAQQMPPAPLRKSDAPPADPAQSGSFSPGTPYQKWLNEDVAYIITPEERAAYRKLQTDEEREQFIQQFWLIRDPTPGTPENEFKTEHYRRIAYANQHFASAIPGWKTGRGRFYITWGPPDEIDDHLSPPDSYQIWQYRFIEGIGANVRLRFFVDPKGDSFLAQILSPPARTTFEGVSNGQPIPSGHSSVQIYPYGYVQFSIPRNFSAGPFDIAGEIRTTNNRPVSFFRDFGPAGESPQTEMVTLLPGSYTFKLVLTDKSTNQTYTETVPFDVTQESSSFLRGYPWPAK